jgi:hypothetical protein
MVEALKRIIVATLWAMLAVYWGLVVIAALEGFSPSIIFYIVYGIFATGASVFYASWVRSV